MSHLLRSFRSFVERSRGFASDRRANVAMTFAFSLIPIIGLVGIAVDYTRASAIRATLQSALDATALAVSKTASAQTSSQLQSSAQTFFNGVFNVSGVADPTITATYTPASTSNATVKISANLSAATTFMGMFGVSSLPISASSTTTWGNTRLRVALALDNTGSMASSGKIGALQTATLNLLSQLKGAAVNNGDVYVSIIPFAKVVNIGTSNYTASWIDWTDWNAAPDNSMPDSTDGPGTACPYGTNVSPYGYPCTATPTSSTTVSTIPSSGTYSGYICPGPDTGRYNDVATYRDYNGCYNSVAGTQTCTTKNGKKTCTTPYSHTWIVNSHTTWDGTIMDRTQDYDTLNTAPTTTATNFPASQATSIDATPLAMMPLSYSWTDLNNEVNNMSPGGGTNQAIGLAWAWQSLTSGAPLFAPAEDPKYAYTHVIILLSDGLNTEDRWYGDGTTYSSQVDARQKILCDNIKAAGTTIYAIQVNTDNEATSSVLQYCASDTSKFVLLTTASQIVATFQQIGVNLSQLRVAK